MMESERARPSTTASGLRSGRTEENPAAHPERSAQRGVEGRAEGHVPLPGEANCAGTMDVAAEARRRAPGLRVVAADFSREMLARGARKTGFPAAQADALALPFPAARFDLATVAFGVRNLDALDRGLAELARVLRPGGRLGVLEFFRPESQGSRFVHGAYNRLALPVLGRVLSPDPAAYRYLVASMERFASRPEFEAACRQAGFEDVRGETLFPGVCGLVTARRA